jgi:hypothetical protein
VEDSAANAGAVKLEVHMFGAVIVPIAQTFTRTWHLVNKGTTWCEQARLRVSEQSAPDAEISIQIPDIAPGAAVDVPVILTAPEEVGTYKFNWQLQIHEGPAKSNEFPVSVAMAILAETPHPYFDGMDQTWTLTNPDSSAIASQVHFTQVETEVGESGTVYDYIEVQSADGTVIQTISGTYPTGLMSEKVPGTVVKIRFYSDVSNTMYGFAIDQIVTNNTTTYKKYFPVIQRPRPTPTSYVICTCNTVEVCTCNLVCTCESVCSCDGYCSCNRVCTCQSVCSCVGNHYWYPN